MRLPGVVNGYIPSDQTKYSVRFTLRREAARLSKVGCELLDGSFLNVASMIEWSIYETSKPAVL